MNKSQSRLNKLDSLLDKANALPKKSLQQFEKNLQTLLNIDQVAYQFLSTQPMSQYAIVTTGNEISNIRDCQTNQTIYPIPIKDLVDKQLAQFQHNPGYCKVQHQVIEQPLKNFHQYELLSPLIHAHQKELDAFNGNLKAPIGVLIIVGLGLGLHVQALIEQYDIKNILIIEPSKELFSASLYTMDWTTMINQCQEKTINLYISLDKSPYETFSSLKNIFHQNGQHLLANTFVFTHLVTETIIQTMQVLQNSFSECFVEQGFLEDEQISIAHTSLNIQNKVPILSTKKPPSSRPPIFIIGNGPSLDGLIKAIERNRNNVILFSCGSAIASLYHANLTPDFHIEMERTAETSELIKESVPLTYSQNIRLFGLNTLPPSIFDLFKEGYIAGKDNDSGFELLNQSYGEPINQLRWSNPTCTNSALSLAIALGFSDIYLFGIDLGFRNVNKHHAAISDYYVDDKHYHVAREEERHIEVRGNFSHSVMSTEVLINANKNMAMLINEHPHIHVYNLNDGAYIEGSHALKKADIPVFDDLEDKEALLNDMLKQNTIALDVETISLTPKEIASHFRLASTFLNKDQFDFKPNDISNVHEHISQLINEINQMKKTEPLSYQLIYGSCHTFFLYILKLCHLAKDKSSLLRLFEEGTLAFKSFQQMAATRLADELMMCDKIEY